MTQQANTLEQVYREWHEPSIRAPALHLEFARTNTRLLDPDRSRVLVRPFRLTSEQRATNLCARVMALTEEEVQQAAGGRAGRI